jgi:heme A synthase
MGNSVKKVISYLLIGLVVIFTLLALLGIWDVISLEEIVRKMFLSLMVIFAASAVILFIFSVLIKDSDIPKRNDSVS